MPWGRRTPVWPAGGGRAAGSPRMPAAGADASRQPADVQGYAHEQHGQRQRQGTELSAKAFHRG